MAPCSEIKLTAVEWSPEAESALAELGEVADYRRQVENGAALFEVTCGSDRVGFYILRVDQLAAGPEAVLFAAVGDLSGVDLTVVLLPRIEKQFIGCQTMRIHTKRTGLVKKLVAGGGYGPVEWVLRKKIA